MRLPYTANITDDDTGALMLVDIECQVDISVEFDGGKPRLDIYGVHLIAFDGTVIDLWRGSRFQKLLAVEITERAEKDDGLLERALEAGGYVFRPAYTQATHGNLNHAMQGTGR